VFLAAGKWWWTVAGLLKQRFGVAENPCIIKVRPLKRNSDNVFNKRGGEYHGLWMRFQECKEKNKEKEINFSFRGR